MVPDRPGRPTPDLESELDEPAELAPVRVPWWFALEFLFPGVYEVEWWVLFL